MIELATKHAEEAGVLDRCEFVPKSLSQGDLVLSLDAFEHFDDPAGILCAMRDCLHDRGEALISFGPTWYHPYGAHLFSVFPWAHLIFTERALIRWRSDFKTDGATRFSEVSGGLNQMTIRRFLELVDQSPFQFVEFETVPIRGWRFLTSNSWTREFFISMIRCRLKPRV